jgi:signal transduction histidine kinase
MPETNASIERIIRDARAADEVMQHIRGLFKQESFDKKQVGIWDVLSEAVRFLHGDPRGHDLSIDWQLDEHLPTVLVDLTQIQQVFINLISNATEALAGSQISPHIIVRATTTDQNQMLIQVIDNGPGVTDQERIFDAFVTTKKNGMGIGLAISRSIVEAHGGRLWAENNPSGGATFSVALPLSSSQSSSSSSYPAQTDFAKDRRCVTERHRTTYFHQLEIEHRGACGGSTITLPVCYQRRWRLHQESLG